MSFRNSFSVIVVVVVTMCGLMPIQASGQESQVRIGTFDSRAVAVAYVRSNKFQERMKGLMTELEKAKSEGKAEKVKQLEAAGPALQHVIHKQGFSTYPIDNILGLIKEKLPQIAEEADVDVMVSKWDLVYQNKDLKTIDVTKQLVGCFDPNEQTLKVIEELRKQDPVPLDDIKKH